MIIFYCLIFLSLWTVGAIMLINNRSNPHTRWFSGLLFLTGFASFSVVINLALMPWLRTVSAPPEAIEALRIFTMIAWGAEYHFLPIVFLLCALVFTRRFNARTILSFSAALSAPIAVYIAAIPPLYPELQLGHPAFRVLSGVYFACGILIYWLRYLIERNPSQQRNSFRTALALTLCISFLYATDYYGMNHFLITKNGLEIASNNMWQLNVLIALIFVAFFVVYAMKYGFMGIKLRIEQQKLDYSMRNLTQGALILNHTIKNEVQKINYLSGRMRSAVEKGDRAETLRNLESLDFVAEHILNMMNQIKDRTGEIEMQEQEYRLVDLLEYSVQTLSPMLEEKRIQLVTDIGTDPILLCDAAHVKEVLNNVLVNAVDAMEPDKGKLSITLAESKKEVMIWIKDNGAGVSEESAARMFDPFFTTKKGLSNYGLGLNYCYGVMHKHGGSIRLVETELGKGTWMEIRFPAKRVRMLPMTERPARMRVGVF
ncbi:sensor histidine kinase [Paenibacillus gansuensis]|uniref:histidine kinase n=1 Tax=Paenibacillus gansuensis TaxID=306542 RepID=A0ABW5PAH0_9BACL